MLPEIIGNIRVAFGVKYRKNTHYSSSGIEKYLAIISVIIVLVRLEFTIAKNLHRKFQMALILTSVIASNLQICSTRSVVPRGLFEIKEIQV